MLSELSKIKETDCKPVVSPFGDYLYIQFELDGVLYYYSMDANPFFGVTWCKRPIIDGSVRKEYYYSHTENAKWLTDSFLGMYCSREDIKKAARKIFDTLVKANFCERCGRGATFEKVFPLEIEKLEG